MNLRARKKLALWTQVNVKVVKIDDNTQTPNRRRIASKAGAGYLYLLAGYRNMSGLEINRALVTELQDRSSDKWNIIAIWGDQGPPLPPTPRPLDWDATFRTKQDERLAALRLMVENREEMESEDAARRAAGGAEGAGGIGGGVGGGVTDMEGQLIEYLDRNEENELSMLLEKARNSNEPHGGLTPEQQQVLKVAAQKAKEKKQKYDEEVVRVEGIRSMIQAAMMGRGAGGGGGGGGSGSGGYAAPLRARLPTFNSSGEDRSDYRSHLQAVRTCLALQKVAQDQEKKQFFFLSFDQKARYRMAATLDPELPEVKRLTFDQYVTRANELFEPTSESEIWKADFRQLIQKRSDSIQDYLQHKSTLYKRAYGSRITSAEHLLEEAISGIYNSEVRKEVIRSMPKTYEELLTIGLRATGFVRRTGNYARPQEHGLASVSHKEINSRSGPPGGHLGQMGNEEEADDEDEWDDPLTLGEVQCCIKNETEIETSYWHEQLPAGLEEDSLLEEMEKGPTSSFKNLPPGAGCWSCGGPHYKAICPLRLKVVQQRVGRRGAPRRRVPTRTREYVNSNSRDARRGNYPVRSGPNAKPTVGEVAEDEDEERWAEQDTLGGLASDQSF